MSKILNFFKSIALYTIVAFLPSIVRFLLFPIYVNKLTPEDYGILALHGSIIAILIPIFSLSIEHAYGRCFFDFNKNINQIKEYLSTIISASLLIELLFSGIYLIIAPLIFERLFTQGDYSFYPYGILALIFVVSSIPTSILLLFLRNKNIPLGYFLVYVTNLILTTSLELYVIFFDKPSAKNILIARTLATTLHSFLTLISIGILYKLKPIIKIKPYLIETIKYGIPLIPYILLTVLYFHIDKIVVKKNLSTELLGIYNVAFVIVSVAETFSNALDNAMVPEIFNYWTKNNTKNVKRILNFMLWLINLTVLLGTLTGTIFIYTVAPKEYEMSYKIIAPLFIVILVRSLFIVVVKPLFFFKKHKYLFLVNIFSIIGILIGGYLLLPYIGLWGMVLTLILARSLKLTITYFIYKLNLKHFNGFKLNNTFHINQVFLSIFILFSIGIITYYYNLKFYFLVLLISLFFIVFLFMNLKPLFYILKNLKKIRRGLLPRRQLVNELLRFFD